MQISQITCDGFDQKVVEYSIKLKSSHSKIFIDIRKNAD